MVSVIFMITYAPAAVLAMWVLERYGTRTTLVTAALLNAIGTTLKYVGTLPALIAMPQAGMGLILLGQVRAWAAAWDSWRWRTGSSPRKLRRSARPR